MGSIGRGIFLFFLVGISAHLKSQEEAFHFHHLSEQLTSRQYNYYIYKDSIGFVWISSTNGVNRFDGREVKQIQPIPGPANYITSPFFEDGNSDLWFQVDNSLCRYDRRRDSFLVAAIPGRPVFLENNLLWLVDDGYLKTYDFEKDELTGSQKIGGGAGHGIRMFPKMGSPGKILFIPKGHGFQVLHVRRDEPLDTLFTMHGQPAFKAHTFLPESGDTWWVGADTGLVRVQLGATDEVKVFSHAGGSVLRTVKGIVPAGENKLVVATHKDGLYFFEKTKQGGKFTHQVYSHNGKETAPFVEQVDEIYLDNTQNLWVSTQGNGVFFTNLQKRKFKIALHKGPDRPKGLNQVEAMSMDVNGRIWCLTKNGIAVIDSSGRLVDGYEQYIGSKTPFSGTEPMHIFCDSGGSVWIGMQLNLFTIPAFGKAIERVAGSRGTVFIGELDGGVVAATMGDFIQKVFFEDGKPVLRDLPGLQGYPGDYLMIHQSRLQGAAFFCRGNEEILAFRQMGEHFELIDSFRLEGLVTGFADDLKTGKTWVASESGLFYFEKTGEGLKLRQDTILPRHQFQGVLINGKDGKLWLSSANGFFSYDPSPGQQKWKSYSLADGLQSNEFNFWSALKVSDQRFLFGGVDGVNIFDPSAVRELPFPARPVITNITVRDREPLPWPAIRSGWKNISHIEKIELGYTDNSLRIQFAALEYSDPGANLFRYKLKGPDGELENSGSEHTVSFANLREGHYEFTLWASNSDGVFSGQEASSVKLEINILPPWYRSRWFYSLVAAAVLSAGYLVYKRRVAQIKKEEAMKSQLAELRQKEAEAKQQMAETETAILRLQMNPHFIFNSMNSINSYILKKDVGTASGYLGRFAKLMRMILKYAANPFIAISEEIELLELYLQTEAMRFEGNFTFEFRVDEELDPDETILPTMILQPFVENAVWHGLSSKEKGGHILVSFEKQNGQLVCTVEDNGGGRSAARHQTDSPTGHESKALSITERRLALLAHEAGREAFFKITDLKNADGTPSGTKVVLTLPLL